MKNASISLDPRAASYQFGPILINVASRQIWRHGSLVTVPSKAFDALIYLAARPDRTVSKEELISAVWKNMFVSEDSLFHSMSVLRRALGDDSTNPELIITVPRKGYRLKGPVREVFEAPSDVSAPAVAPDFVASGGIEVPIQPPVRRAGRRWPKIGILLAVAFVLFLVVRGFVIPRTLPHGATILFTQSAPPGATLASGGILSPDSRYMVFVAHDQKAAQARLYLKEMDSPELRPVAGTEGASHPFWSPASDVIGFFANGELKTVNLRGDVPKAIATVPVSAGGRNLEQQRPHPLFRLADRLVSGRPDGRARNARHCGVAIGGPVGAKSAAIPPRWATLSLLPSWSESRSNRQLRGLSGLFSVGPAPCAIRFSCDLRVPGLCPICSGQHPDGPEV
jgi:DNA-binding winged helix-turn-helix (wHTH) protein